MELKFPERKVHTLKKTQNSDRELCYDGNSNSRWIDLEGDSRENGCPEVRMGYNSPCDNGWYQYTIWCISWGLIYSWPLPLIYGNDGANSRQWYSLSAYGHDLQNGKMDIQGALTQILFRPLNDLRIWDILVGDGKGVSRNEQRKQSKKNPLANCSAHRRIGIG